MRPKEMKLVNVRFLDKVDESVIVGTNMTNAMSIVGETKLSTQFSKPLRTLRINDKEPNDSHGKCPVLGTDVAIPSSMQMC
jgi:hypothetical protein